MRNVNKNAALNKGCHSRKLLSGICNAGSYVREQQTTCVEDPRLQTSGMTPLLNKLSGHALTYNGGSPSPLVGEDARRAGEGFSRGFTLIELLVVILIIGILAAVALPQYQKAVMKSRYAMLQPLVHAIANAQEVHYLEHGEYATNLADLAVLLPGEKLDTSTDTQYEYNWGECHLTSNVVVCRNTQINMGYTVFFQHVPDTNNAGTRQCYVYGSTKEADLPLPVSICRAETGLSKKTASGTLASSGLQYLRYKYPTR